MSHQEVRLSGVSDTLQNTGNRTMLPEISTRKGLTFDLKRSFSDPSTKSLSSKSNSPTRGVPRFASTFNTSTPSDRNVSSSGSPGSSSTFPWSSPRNASSPTFDSVAVTSVYTDTCHRSTISGSVSPTIGSPRSLSKFSRSVSPNRSYPTPPGPPSARVATPVTCRRSTTQANWDNGLPSPESPQLLSPFSPRLGSPTARTSVTFPKSFQFEQYLEPVSSGTQSLPTSPRSRRTSNFYKDGKLIDLNMNELSQKLVSFSMDINRRRCNSDKLDRRKRPDTPNPLHHKRIDNIRNLEGREKSSSSSCSDLVSVQEII